MAYKDGGPISNHERFLANLPPERAKFYKADLEQELSEITEKRLKLLEARGKYLERIDRALATLDQRQKEITTDFRIMEGLYFPSIEDDIFPDGLPHF